MCIKRFEKLENLFQYSEYKHIWVEKDSENLYIANEFILFKFPIQYEKEVLCIFEGIDMKLENFKLEMCEYYDGKKEIIQSSEKIIHCKKFFENTDFVSANITTIAGINEEALYMAHINPFINIMSNLSEFTYFFETEDGLLEMNSNYCNFVIEIMQLFSDKKAKKFVNRKNNHLYIENDILKAMITPIRASDEKERLFSKKFLI